METEMADERGEEIKDDLRNGDSKPASNGNGSGPDGQHTESAGEHGSKFHKPGGAKIATEKKEYANQVAQEQKTEENKEKERSITRNPLFIVMAIIIAIALIFWGISFYRYSQTHVSTDDAYVTGDLVNISPIIAGTLQSLTVEEGDVVKKGQLIAQLDPSGPRASYQQALAAYQAAESQIPQAQTQLSYETASVAAGISNAEAGLGAQNAKANAAAQQVVLSSETTHSQLDQARAQDRQAQASAKQALAQVKTAQAEVQNQNQAVETAQRAANSAHAQIDAAQANQVKASRDEQRYEKLLQQDAVTQEQYDSELAASQTADAQLDSVQQQAAQADSTLEQARLGVQQMLAQLAAAEEAAQAAEQQVQYANSGISLAVANLTQIGVQRSNLQNSQALAQQNTAELTAAKAESQNVELRKQQVTTAMSQAAQAHAALDNAQVTLNDTQIFAPSDGTIVRKGANIGDSLSPGQTIATMTQTNYVWVSANFKETQLQGVKPGQSAEVEVDAFPGIVFKGYVKSINEASGNATALLPADNATGNFTKVVQRIPVRIELKADSGDGSKYATQDQVDQLRQGMSVEATIDTSSK
jgi:membrane fusion protein, multidrug efflux system